MTDKTKITLRTDSQGCITMEELAKATSSLRIQHQASGNLVLEPCVEIPERDHWLYNDPKAMCDGGTVLAVHSEVFHIEGFFAPCPDDTG
jgi:hypothetical protein